MQLRHIVTRPLIKGDVSTQLTARLDPPYPRYCRPERSTYGTFLSASALFTRDSSSSRVPHRLCCGAFQAGRGGRRTCAGRDGGARALQPIRNYLRFLGLATPNDVAAFLDSPVAEIKAHWPADAAKSALMAGKVDSG